MYVEVLSAWLRKWYMFQKNVRPLRPGLGRKGFRRWDGVGLEVGIKGHVGFGYGCGG